LKVSFEEAEGGSDRYSGLKGLGHRNFSEKQRTKEEGNVGYVGVNVRHRGLEDGIHMFNVKTKELREILQRRAGGERETNTGMRETCSAAYIVHWGSGRRKSGRKGMGEEDRNREQMKRSRGGLMTRAAHWKIQEPTARSRVRQRKKAKRGTRTKC